MTFSLCWDTWLWFIFIIYALKCQPHAIPTKHAFIVYFFFKSVFKLESKSYLQISFCKGCTHHRLNTTVGDSVEGIDKVYCPLWWWVSAGHSGLTLLSVLTLHPYPLGESTKALFWTRSPDEDEKLTSFTLFWRCFNKTGEYLDAVCKIDFQVWKTNV